MYFIASHMDPSFNFIGKENPLGPYLDFFMNLMICIPAVVIPNTNNLPQVLA